MGDIAEMMLEGILCEGCGEYMGAACGHPRKCGGCSGNAYRDPEDKTAAAKRRRKRNRARRGPGRKGRGPRQL